MRALGQHRSVRLCNLGYAPDHSRLLSVPEKTARRQIDQKGEVVQRNKRTANTAKGHLGPLIGSRILFNENRPEGWPVNVRHRGQDFRDMQWRFYQNLHWGSVGR